MTEVALLVLRVGLALIFATAGIAKLVDRPGTQRTLVSFGLPERLGRASAVLLPLLELAAAGALLASASARWGALAALVLLGVFIGGLSNAIAHGRTPDCHCFGQLHSKPASWRTVGRNVGLAVVASALVADSHPQRIGFPVLVATIATAGGVALLTVLRLGPQWLPQSLRVRMMTSRRLIAVARGASRLGILGPDVTDHAKGLSVGTSAPDFALRNPDDELVTLSSLQKRAKPMLLIFSDPGCKPCVELLPEIPRWQRENEGRLTIAVITSRPQHPVTTLPYASTNVLVQQDREVASAYVVRDMPSAVFVSTDGIIGSPLAVGREAIAALLDRIAGSATV